MPLSLEYFRDRERPEPDWIIPNFLKRKNTAFIIGRPKKACKSWLMLNMGWQLSEGKPIWGIRHSRNGFIFEPPRPMRVVYFSQEDTEDDIHDRIHLLLKSGWEANPNFYFVPKNLSLSLDVGMESILIELDKAREEGPIDLVMFDPLRRMHKGKENESETFVVLWSRLSLIHNQYNCSSLFSHHIVKPPSNGVWDELSPFSGRGSGDIYGGGDAFINVMQSKTRGQSRKTRYLDLRFESKRSLDPEPATLMMDFETGIISFLKFTNGRPKEEEDED